MARSKENPQAEVEEIAEEAEPAEIGTCGVAVGQQVDLATALQFDRQQEAKARSEAEKRAADERLKQAQEIVNLSKK